MNKYSKIKILLKKDFRGIAIYALFKISVFVNEIISTLILNIILKLKGIKNGKKVKYFGLPYFFRFPGSQIIIGDNCIFRSDKTSNLSKKKKCIIKTFNSDSEISIGTNSGMNSSVITAAKKIEIGENVLIGYNCYITDTDNHSVTIENRHDGIPESRPVSIHNNVWLGANVTILKGVTIGENSVISAGSVVYSSIPSNVIAMGNPCRVIQKIDS